MSALLCNFGGQLGQQVDRERAVIMLHPVGFAFVRGGCVGDDFAHLPAPAAIKRIHETCGAGERTHPTMNAQAQGLSEADMADIAAYFAAQQPRAKK